MLLVAFSLSFPFFSLSLSLFFFSSLRPPLFLFVSDEMGVVLLHVTELREMEVGPG